MSSKDGYTACKTRMLSPNLHPAPLCIEHSMQSDRHLSSIRRMTLPFISDLAMEIHSDQDTNVAWLKTERLCCTTQNPSLEFKREPSSRSRRELVGRKTHQARRSHDRLRKCSRAFNAGFGQSLEVVYCSLGLTQIRRSRVSALDLELAAPPNKPHATSSRR